jgi:hypothetical protein
LSLVSKLKGKDDAVTVAEVNTTTNDNGKLMVVSPGSVTMACVISGTNGNPGDPAPALKERENAL